MIALPAKSGIMWGLPTAPYLVRLGQVFCPIAEKTTSEDQVFSGYPEGWRVN